MKKINAQLQIAVTTKNRIYVGGFHTDYAHLFDEGETVTVTREYQMSDELITYLENKLVESADFLETFYQMVAHRVIKMLGMDKKNLYIEEMTEIKKENPTIANYISMMVRELKKMVKNTSDRLATKLYKQKRTAKKIAVV